MTLISYKGLIVADMSRRKKQNNKQNKMPISFKVVIAMLAFLEILAVFFIWKNAEVGKQYFAKRIANKYLKEEYGAELEVYEISDAAFMMADYSVRYKISDKIKVYVGVSLKERKVIYDNYLEAYIFDKMNQKYCESIEEIWDKQADVEFDGFLSKPEVYYYTKGVGIDYEKAMNEEAFDLHISTEDSTLEQNAHALYRTFSYLKENNIKIGQITFSCFSGDGHIVHDYYIIEDIDQFTDADMILEYLKNYTDEE